MRFLISVSLSLFIASQSLVFASGSSIYKIPEPLQDKELSGLASASWLGLKSGKMIFDNDDSFERKLDSIKAARNQEIRAIYYLYGQDESASLFTHELIKAANERGNKVYLMVDYISNFANLDLFSYMEKATRGRIQVRLYGRPSPNILKDAVYMTMACPNPAKTGPGKTVFDDNCKPEKIAFLNKILANFPDPYLVTTEKAGLFMTGIMAKSPDLSAMAMLEGQQIDVKSFTGANSKPMSADDKKGLTKILKLYWDSKVHHSIGATIKLWIASLFYAKAVRPPLNALSNVFPFGLPGGENMGQEWDHISDYTHHKLLLVTAASGSTADFQSFQLGGRNIENSYHMRPNPLLLGKSGKPKYVFMDTDFYGEFESEGKRVGPGTARDMANAFDRMWNFHATTARLAEVRLITPNDVLMNAGRAKAQCKAAQSEDSYEEREIALMAAADTAEKQLAVQKQLKDEFKACAQEKFVDGYQDLDARLVSVQANLEQRLVAYDGYLAVRDTLPSTDPDANAPRSIAIDTPSLDGYARAFYMENLHFANPYSLANSDQRGQVQSGAIKEARAYEAKTDKEVLTSKYIHRSIVRGMQNVCLTTAKAANEARAAGLPLPAKKYVIINNAYVIFPSNVAEVFASMVNGDLDCSQVNVRIISNSINTTDLNIINPFAKMGVHAMAAVYRNQRHATKGADFRIYEYNDIKNDQGAVSLHSKVWVLGDDILIGSANADVRSYMMDTNNGIYIRGAKNMIGEYVAYLNSQMALADKHVAGAKLKELTTQYAQQVSPVRDETPGQAVMRGYNAYLKENDRFLKEKIIDRWRLENFIGADKVKRLEELYFNLQVASYRDMLLGLAKIPTPASVQGTLSKNIPNACWVADALGEFGKNKDGEQLFSTSPGVWDEDRYDATLRIRNEARSVGEKFDRRFQLL